MVHSLVNLLNPKLSIFFLAFLPQFVDTGQLLDRFKRGDDAPPRLPGVSVFDSAGRSV